MRKIINTFGREDKDIEYISDKNLIVKNGLIYKLVPFFDVVFANVDKLLKKRKNK